MEIFFKFSFFNSDGGILEVVLMKSLGVSFASDFVFVAYYDFRIRFWIHYSGSMLLNGRCCI
ncbi:hypothetical protein, partial [Ralstonia solanacearum]|uniref:hypothetical protein n=1 Tax=Ralstonia solanacearum TaxID=305 RepID=UPI0009B9DCF8